MASRTYYHSRMPCQALCKKEHALRACGLGAGGVWDIPLRGRPLGLGCAKTSRPQVCGRLGAWEPTGLPRPRHRNGLKQFLMTWG